jgi:hypothetical protein
MLQAILSEDQRIMDAIKYLPSVSVIMPFEPKMSLKHELEYQLKLAVQQVQKELKAKYPGDKAEVVIGKLKELVKQLDYSSFKKSIAFFVSPVVEKVFYLDIPVERKIIIDESFEIRDLVYSKKDIHKYLLLVLSGKQSRIFLGNTTAFLRIAFNAPEHIAALRNDVPERVGNFSDPQARKEVMLDKFLYHIDNALTIIVKAYRLPLFVMGTDRTVGHFKKLTHNGQYIIGHIPGNYEEASDAEIREAVKPYVADWKKVKQDDLLHQLDGARGTHKVAIGMKEVWNEATHHKGRLLIVEKNYMYPARQDVGGENIYQEDFSRTNNPFYIKDAVDDVIEKVLDNGGDVEFVDEGVLQAYDRIALIKYY